MASSSQPPSPERRGDAAAGDEPSSGTTAPQAIARALVTTAIVAALSYALPEEHAATGVGLAFLTATYMLALRGGTPGEAERAGLSLGGLMEPEPLEARRLLREGAHALGVAVACAVVVFPLFWAGYVAWWHPRGTFDPSLPPDLIQLALGQALVIALPEEAFYRGYLQRALDDAWPPHLRILGANVGPSLIVSSGLFALGHVLTEVHPNRLAVFFPALLFGWLRARTGGIGAPLAFHALCNVFASYLARGYGFVT